MMQKYRVVRIMEKDFGCEEVPSGMSRMEEVELQSAGGETRVVDVPDCFLTEQKIYEGSEVVLRPDGTVEPVQ